MCLSRFKGIRPSMGTAPGDMAKKVSSRKKHTKKAGTQNRSTTSSTTKTEKQSRKNPVESDQSDSVKPMPQEMGGDAQKYPIHLSAEESGSCLTPEQKKSFLHLFSRGASPSAASRELGVPVSLFLQAVIEDDEFRAEWEKVNTTLSQNVVAALYRSAMEGKVSAQTYWLKNNPPPGWVPETQEPLSSIDEFFDKLSEEELIDLARAMDINLPPEIEAKISPSGGESVADGISS